MEDLSMTGYVDGISPGGQAEPGGFQIAAAGDLKCTGGYCSSGGTYGTTAFYEIRGRQVCRDCAVKLLKLEGLSGGEQAKRLEPYLIP
jgi:hypothetical protein